jgi:PKHD-type hydroxylase
LLITIPSVLDADELRLCRDRLAAAQWQDGRHTAGALAAQVKHNQQIPPRSPLSRELGEIVLRALGRSPLFIAAALPLHILPPMFNRYLTGETYGVHVDAAMQAMPDGQRVRTDLSATLFLAEPEEYEGGELTIETAYGAQGVKLPAGDLVLYPATSLHCVTPVTSGARTASFFWIQSMIRDEAARSMLFDLDQTIQQLQAERGIDDPASVRLSGIYHNLIRQWAET